MAMIEIDRNPSPRTLLLFGFLLAAFAGLVGWLLAWRFDAPEAARWVWIVGGALGLLCVALPPIRRPLYLAWSYAFYPIGWVLSHVLLAAIWYLVLTPIGLLLRLFGRDPLGRRRDPQARTHWVPYRSRSDADRYFRQF